LASLESPKILKKRRLQRRVARVSERCARDCASEQDGESEKKEHGIPFTTEDRWKFVPVLDSRNRKIKGLSQRNGRIYGTIWVSRDYARSSCRRFPLLDEDGKAVITINAAKAAYERLRAKAREEKLPLAGQKPTLADFSAEYLTSASTQSKRPRTIKKEGQSLGLWVAICGSLKIDRISTPTIRLYIEKRLKGALIKGRKTYPAASPRTVAVDIIALRNILKTALDAGLIREIPRFPKLIVPPPRRRSLVSNIDFQRLLDGCSQRKSSGEPVSKNGLQLQNLLLLLDACGARETEAYSITWKHVDFSAKKLWLGADPEFDATISLGSTGVGGTSKNRRSRSVEFNPQLERHLFDMKERRDQNSIWVFPSPKRGKVDRPFISFRESLNLVREFVGLKDFGFHDCRHRFASRCVMAGIDYMTIAKWLGHSDGGILVGKVYGHLSDEHRKRMAQRLEELL
jgi:integrase